jgi:hypothetical protein
MEEQKSGLADKIKGKEKTIGAIIGIVIMVLGAVLGFNSEGLKQAIGGCECAPAAAVEQAK